MHPPETGHLHRPQLAYPIAGLLGERVGQRGVHQDRAWPGELGESAGEVDHRAVDVPEPAQHPARGQPGTNLGQPLVRTGLFGERQGDLGGLPGLRADEQPLVTDELDDTAVVFTTLPSPVEGTSESEAESVKYVSDLEVLCLGLPPCLLVHSNSMTVTMNL